MMKFIEYQAEHLKRSMAQHVGQEAVNNSRFVVCRHIAMALIDRETTDQTLLAGLPWKTRDWGLDTPCDMDYGSWAGHEMTLVTEFGSKALIPDVILKEKKWEAQS